MVSTITSESAIAFVKQVVLPEAIAYGDAKREMFTAIKKCQGAIKKLLGAVEPGLRETLAQILRDEIERESR